MIEITPEFLKQRGCISSNGRLPYNPNLNDRAKKMRRIMPQAEKKLWFDFLRNTEHRFLRQRVIDNYIVDFYCSSLNLVIEIDGESHFEDGAPEYDLERTEILNGYGLKVIRFTNGDIYNNFEGVCNTIKSRF